MNDMALTAFEQVSWDPLGMLIGIAEGVQKPRRDGIDPCQYCRLAIKEDIAREREKLWDTLPELLGLPSWKEMLAKNDSSSEDTHSR